MSATRIGIVGAGGRMGRMLIEATLKGEGVVLGAAFDVPGRPAVGKNAGELVGMASDVVVSDDLAAGLKQVDVLIDFTRPQGTLVHLELCRQAGVGMVIGTTGLKLMARQSSRQQPRMCRLFSPRTWRSASMSSSSCSTWRRAL